MVSNISKYLVVINFHGSVALVTKTQHSCISFVIRQTCVAGSGDRTGITADSRAGSGDCRGSGDSSEWRHMAVTVMTIVRGE